MDLVRTTCRLRHFSPRTEEAYAGWIRRFIVFHGKRHPSTMGDAEITAFLSSLATTHHVAASTQNQARNALLFLYDAVLLQPIANLQGVVRARTPARLPVVLSKAEVGRMLDALSGTSQLIATLLYGSGLRLSECLDLRVTVQELLGHADVSTTMIYTHVLNLGALGVTDRCAAQTSRFRAVA